MIPKKSEFPCHNSCSSLVTSKPICLYTNEESLLPKLFRPSVCCILPLREGELTGAKHREAQSAKEGFRACSLPRTSRSVLRQRREAATYTAPALHSSGRLPAQPRDATLPRGEEEEPTPFSCTRQLRGSGGKERIRRGCSQRGFCQEGSKSSCPMQQEVPSTFWLSRGFCSHCC